MESAEADDRNKKSKVTKVRSANLTPADYETIIELAMRHSGVLENKKMDAVTAQDKETVWKAIACEFNASSSAKRNHSQLKQAYENRKKKAKQAASSDKVEKKRTGGGSYDSQVTATDEKLLAILGNRIRPLPNRYDSDADYHEPVDPMAMIDTIDYGDIQVPPPINTDTGNMETVNVRSDEVLASSSAHGFSYQLLTATDGQQQLIPVESDPLKTRDAAVESRKWAGRRRPQYNTRLNPVAARSLAAEKIGALSDEKREYYRAKLEMRRAEHEQRMKVLHLKEQLLQQKLLQNITEAPVDEE